MRPPQHAGRLMSSGAATSRTQTSRYRARRWTAQPPSAVPVTRARVIDRLPSTNSTKRGRRSRRARHRGISMSPPLGQAAPQRAAEIETLPGGRRAPAARHPCAHSADQRCRGAPATPHLQVRGLAAQPRHPARCSSCGEARVSPPRDRDRAARRFGVGAGIVRGFRVRAAILRMQIRVACRARVAGSRRRQCMMCRLVPTCRAEESIERGVERSHVVERGAQDRAQRVAHCALVADRRQLEGVNRIQQLVRPDQKAVLATQHRAERRQVLGKASERDISPRSGDRAAAEIGVQTMAAWLESGWTVQDPREGIGMRIQDRRDRRGP